MLPNRICRSTAAGRDTQAEITKSSNTEDTEKNGRLPDQRHSARLTKIEFFVQQHTKGTLRLFPCFRGELFVYLDEAESAGVVSENKRRFL